MWKKVGIPVLALAALLALTTPSQATAGVRIGVYLGAPAYYPAYPVYPYPDPYPAYYYGYPAYAYPAPVYVYPYAYSPYGYGFGFSYRSYPHHEHGRREFREHRGYVGRGYAGHGHGRYRR